MGALAAAFELVRRDPGRYEVTVYQRGWRLGGKGASGRNLEPGKGLRIEEHGLHILMGFYDNVFHILKTCYDELGAAPADPSWHDVGPWDEALSPADSVQICDRYRNGDCAFWEIHLPALPAQRPGSRLPSTEPDIAEWLQKGFAFLYEAVRHSDGEPGNAEAARRAASHEPLRALRRLGRLLAARRRAREGRLSDLVSGVGRRAIRAALRLLFHRLGDAERRDPVTVSRRRQAMAAYFVGANLLGIFEERLWRKQDFLRVAERLDEIDYRSWLHRCAGPVGERWPELAWSSPLVTSVYNLIFSREAGFGAGSALYDTLSMLLNYWGHLYYRMNGGMGDVVFAPLYLWLRRHGVRFRFFHRVRRLRLDGAVRADGAPRIGEIVVERQLHLDRPYDPLIPVKGRPCWPARPLVEQLSAAEQRRLESSEYDLEESGEPFGPLESLVRGRDFDQVVLGIPVGVLQAEPALAGELAAAHAPFAAMVAGLRTIGTRALQIWIDARPSALGWRAGQAMLGSFQRPFAAWGDMAQVLRREAWDSDSDSDGSPRDGGAHVGGVEYFCDTTGDHEEDDAAAVKRDAIEWLEGSMSRLMPGFSWEHLAAPAGRGRERFDAQYWRANLSPSDRYVLSVPGSSRVRLAPDGSGFENLFLAGDWVRTDLNAGCVEAAAMAGLGAGRALHARALARAGRTAVARARRPLTYVERDADWVLRPPVLVERATLAAFALRADPDALAALCASEVDAATGGDATARPWPERQGLVLLVCGDLPVVRSEDPEQASVGFLHERDVGFFVPVEVRPPRGRRFVALACPYLFVDSAIGLCAGREIFGFSKLLARIEMPAPLPAPAGGFGRELRVAVTADVLSPRPGGAPHAREVHPDTVVEVLPGGRGIARQALEELAPALALRGLLALGRRNLGPVAEAALPLLLFKQFRDEGAARAACHQSLLLCRTTADHLGVPRRLEGGFTIRLPAHAKPDVAGVLGLPHELHPRLAFQLTCDMHLPLAARIWP
jgi:uncharacterized protein with NAD-binding domain and iron-sulfur cluster